VSDAEPDDLIALWLLLGECRRRGTPAESVFVMSTLRDAADSAAVLDKIVREFYPAVRTRVGTSGFKPPFQDASGRLIAPRRGAADGRPLPPPAPPAPPPRPVKTVPKRARGERRRARPSRRRGRATFWPLSTRRARPRTCCSWRPRSTCRGVCCRK
jgi:hypothetical protein